ncbi:MAG: alpha/beta hydrolase [Lachnospiraceae bacterium]|nr:alpha/beta hydrolase [Lachnospiraceae bacterium]
MEEKKAKRKMILKRILMILAGALILYALAMTFVPVAVLSGTVNRRYDYKNQEEEEREGQYVTTSDGERLWMKICPVEEPKGVIIFLSGLSGPAVTEFQAHADWVNELGFAAVLLELRAHGLSGGDQIGLGYKETEDIRASLTEIRKDPVLHSVPVYLFGVSMGASSALVALGELPEIAGVAALSPYASFEEQFEIRMKRALVPPLSRRYVGFLIGTFLNDTYGEEAVLTKNPREEIQKAAGRPVLLIASKGDRKVPCENTLYLRELYPEADLWIREGSAHLVVSGNDLKNLRNDPEYLAKIEEWLEKITR